MPQGRLASLHNCKTLQGKAKEITRGHEEDELCNTRNSCRQHNVPRLQSVCKEPAVVPRPGQPRGDPHGATQAAAEAELQATLEFLVRYLGVSC